MDNLNLSKNIEYEFLFDKAKRFVIKTDDKYPMHFNSQNIFIPKNFLFENFCPI